MRTVINIHGGVARHPDWRLARPVDFTLCEGEHIAIVGPNASGKTMLADLITGAHPMLGLGAEYDFGPDALPRVSDNIAMLTFRDSYGTSDGAYYHQLRWNQHDIDDETPTVAEELERAEGCGERVGESALRQHLDTLFGLGTMLDKKTIMLSSGELRKLQLAKALLARPAVLIMDNPFIGLDADARQQLADLCAALTQRTRLQIILVLSKYDTLPAFITHVVEVRERVVGDKLSRTAWEQQQALRREQAAAAPKLDALSPAPWRLAIDALPYSDFHRDAATGTYPVVELHDVKVRYGSRTILHVPELTIRNGECWALGGKNGSGKSTLLSLVCADNPQAYANHITLFGTRRGTGESIWDIKRHIGYISPELHRAYMKDVPAVEIVASGLRDTTGLYLRPHADQLARCETWMRILGILHLRDRTFLRMSSGEQRMVLVARAFVRDPDLLILDEPLHGLDQERRELVKGVINAFAKRRNKTIIMVSHYAEELPACITHRFELRIKS